MLPKSVSHQVSPVRRSLLSDERGGTAVFVALMLPIVFMVVGTAIDFAGVLRQRTHLQDAADGAVMAAAKELSMIDHSKTDVSPIIQAMVDTAMAANTNGIVHAGKISVTAKAELTPLRVTATVEQPVESFFGPFGLGVSTVSVRSIAAVTGRPNVCVLVLDPSADGAISLEKNAVMTGQNCAVYSNSTHTNSIKSKNSAVLAATMICSAGGKDGSKGNFTPDPITDCPAFADPLAGRAAPPVGGCTATNLVITNQTTTLMPGVYCGGLKINGSSNVTFAQGVYVIKDGALNIDETATVTGEYVGFYLTGTGATFRFATGTTVSLTAPKDGVMAGLLIFEGRTQAAGTHQILSDNARLLLGTIYLPVSELKVDANQPIADQSAYTAIVARKMSLYSGPNLILNTDYDKTPVPVPEGIKGVGQPVSLVQ